MGPVVTRSRVQWLILDQRMLMPLAVVSWLIVVARLFGSGNQSLLGNTAAHRHNNMSMIVHKRAWEPQSQEHRVGY